MSARLSQIAKSSTSKTGCPFGGGASSAPKKRTTKKSLYSRLGGIYTIALVVDHFSNALIHNKIVGQKSANPQLADWHTNKLDRLPGLKWMRTLWVAAISGGPYTYVPTKKGKCPFGLEKAHAEFEISPNEFDAVAHELAKTLDHFKVPSREKSEVLAAFAAHKPDVDRGFFVARGIRPPKLASC